MICIRTNSSHLILFSLVTVIWIVGNTSCAYLPRSPTSAQSLSRMQHVLDRKRPQITWRRRSSLCTISTFQETNNLFQKEMKNVTTPWVQKVPIIMKRTTLILIQNYYCHLPKSHVPHVPRNQLEILTNIHIHDTS